MDKTSMELSIRQLERDQMINEINRLREALKVISTFYDMPKTVLNTAINALYPNETTTD